MSECTEKLKINPALRLLVLPLSTAEYTALETDILTNGSQKPVQCWHSYIISDFERVEICRRHKISFDVYKTNFLSEIEIVAQICERELSERILPSDMRRYLIGKLYNAEKVIAPHRAAGTNQCKERRHRELSRANNQPETRLVHIKERLGRQYHLNPATVTRYAVYANGIDTIFQEDPQKAEQILSGTVKVPVDVVCGYAVSKKGSSYPGNSTLQRLSQSQAEPLISGPSVKDMPTFDPDAGINSLALTIPSWIQSLQRTNFTVDFSLITEAGRKQLRNELRHLINAADTLNSLLEVESNGV